MPSFEAGRRSRVIINEYELTRSVRDGGSVTEIEAADTTTWGQDAKTFISTIADGSLSLQGLWAAKEAALDPHEIDDVFDAIQQADDQLVLLGIGGLAVGKIVNVLQGVETSYERTNPIGDVVAITAEIQASGGVERGISLHDPDTVVAANETGAGQDNGAQTLNGAVAYLHVVRASAGDTIDVKVQHSDDDGAVDPWTDLVTFAQAAAVTSERVVVTGTVKRWVRVISTIAGAAVDFGYAVGFARR